MAEIEMDWPGTARAEADAFYLEPEVAALFRGLADEIEKLQAVTTAAQRYADNGYYGSAELDAALDALKADA